MVCNLVTIRVVSGTWGSGASMLITTFRGLFWKISHLNIFDDWQSLDMFGVLIIANGVSGVRLFRAKINSYYVCVAASAHIFFSSHLSLGRFQSCHKYALIFILNNSSMSK